MLLQNFIGINVSVTAIQTVCIGINDPVSAIQTVFKGMNVPVTAIQTVLQLLYHLHLSLNREGRWGTTDDFTTSFSIFLCSPLPSGTWRTPGLSIPWCCIPITFSVCLVFFPISLSVPLKMVFTRPNEQQTCQYHFSLCLFTMVRRSSCGLIACWILAHTSSLVTWPLYEMLSILQ